MKKEINVLTAPMTTGLAAGQQFGTGWTDGSDFVSKTRGDYAFATKGKTLFHAYATALTIPVIGAQMVSVFSIYNPIGSAYDIELVELELGNVSATTVVNTIGIGFEAGMTVAPVTANQTQGTAYSGYLDGNQASTGNFFTAWTHVGTPVRIGPILQYGAVTNTGAGRIGVDFNGKIILAPGSVVSLCTSTATETNAAAHMSYIKTLTA